MTCSANGGCNLDELIVQICEFAEERDWEQFHSPKNLAMALSVEASELVEIFQWMSEKDSLDLNPQQKARAKEEIADVMTYLIRIADRLDINLLEAVWHKLSINKNKYPADKVRGRAKKYSDYSF